MNSFRLVRGNALEADQNKFSVKALSTILIFTLVLIMVAFFVIYLTVQNHTTEKVYNSEQDIVNNIAYASTVMQDEATSTLMQLYHNPQLMQLIYSINTDRIEISRAMYLLRNLTENSSWIDSAYIYNTREDTFIYSTKSSFSFCTRDRFPDASVLDLFSPGDVNTEIAVMRQFSWNDTRRSVFTYGIPVQNVRDSFDGIFIINVSASQLMDLSNGFTGTPERQIIIASTADNYYVSSYQVLPEEERDALLKQVFSSGEQSGQHIYKKSEERRTAGLAVEKANSIYARGGYTDNEAEHNILSNPFKRFEDMQMLRHTRTLGIIQMDEAVWKHLDETEKAEIEQLCDKKLKAYYQRIENKD